MPQKRRRRRYPKKAKGAQQFKDWATIGREVTINGKDFIVYSRGKLVDTFAKYGIPRTYTTLMNWEKAGILPKSPIIISGKSYYTQLMIETIVITCLECGAGKILQSPDFLKKRLWEEFNKAVNKELF